MKQDTDPQGSTHRWIKNAVVRPFQHPIQPRFVGGPELPDQEDFAPLRHHRFGRAVGEPGPDRGAAPQRLAGDYLYCGPLMASFGHFMAECIHRILPGRRIAPDLPLLFAGRTGALASLDVPYARQVLEFLGIPTDQVTIVHRKVLVDRLLMVPQGSQLGDGASPGYLDLLDSFSPSRLDALVPPDAPGETPPADIYVSRSQLSSGLLLGERCLESWLQDAGYHIYHPQRATLLAQMNTYRRAKRVIFAEGSSCHGVELLGRQLPHTAILNRRSSMNMNAIRSAIQPRSRRYAGFRGNHYVGALPVGLHGKPTQHIGVAVLNARELVDFLARAQLADVAGRVDIEVYRQAAREDFRRYVDRALATAPVAAERIQAAVPELEQALERTLAGLR